MTKIKIQHHVRQRTGVWPVRLLLSATSVAIFLLGWYAANMAFGVVVSAHDSPPSDNGGGTTSFDHLHFPDNLPHGPDQSYRFTILQGGPGNRTIYAAVATGGTRPGTGQTVVPASWQTQDDNCNGLTIYPGLDVQFGGSEVEKTLKRIMVKNLGKRNDGTNYNNGDKICLQATLRLDHSGHALRKTYTIQGLETLSTSQQHIQANSPTGNANTESQYINRANNDAPSKDDFDSFPSQETNYWVENNGRGNWSNNSYDWEEYGAQETPVSSQDYESYDRSTVEPMDQQTASIALSANSTACNGPFDPYASNGLGGAQGICAPMASIDLLIEENGTALESIELYVRDLCKNGWDDHGSTPSVTEVFIEKYSGSGTIASGSGKVIYDNAHPKANNSTARPHDCYQDWIDHLDAGKDSTKSQRSTYLFGDNVAIHHTAQNIKYEDPDSGTLETVSVSKASHHLYEYFKFDPGDLVGGISDVQRVTLKDFGVDSSGSNYLGPTNKTFLKYRLSFRVEDEAAPPNAYYNFFSLGFPKPTDREIILSYSPAGGTPPDPNGWQPRTLTMSNSGYYTNLMEWKVTEAYEDKDRHWESYMDIALPCDVFSNQGIIDDLENFYKPTGGFKQSLPTGVHFKNGSPSTSNLFSPEDEYVVLPIGLFDSDIAGGDYIPHDPGDHTLTVEERDKFGASWSIAEDYYGNPARDLQFDGQRNGLGNDNGTQGSSVAGNKTEAMYIKFKKDKVYRLRFQNIHYRNFIQFVIPFGQEEARKDCGGKPPVVKIDQQCNLTLTSMDWKHPATKEPYGLVNLDIVHEKRSADTGLIVTYPKSGKDYKVVARNMQAVNPESDDGDDPILLPFKSDDSADPDWFSLIENNSIAINKSSDPAPYKWEEVQLTGYYNDDGDLVHIADLADGYPDQVAHDATLETVIADGHGKFRLMENDVGHYYFMSKDENGVDERIPTNSSEYCTAIEFEIEIDDECNIQITKLDWSRPNVSNPKLRLTIIGAGGATNRRFMISKKIDQPITPDNEELFLAWEDRDNPNTVTIKRLLGQPPPSGTRRLRTGSANKYYLQITGSYDGDTLQGVSTTGHAPNYEAGLIASRTNSAPPAILFYIDGTDPDITKIRYQSHKYESAWVPLTGTEGVAPSDPDESCDESPNPEVRFVTDPTDPNVCDLQLIRNAWKNTAGDEQKVIELTITRTNNTGGTAWGPKSIKADSRDLPFTLMEWANPATSVETFKSLIDSGTWSPDDQFLVELTGYYDPHSSATPIRYTDVRFNVAMEAIVVDGDPKFTVWSDGNTPAGHYFKSNPTRAPSGTGVCNPDPPPEPDFEIEVNSDCEIIITQLDWNGYKDDHDSNTGTAALGSANNFFVEIGSVDSGGVFRVIPNDTTEKSFGGSTPQTYYEFVNSNPAIVTLKSLLGNSPGLEANKTYEVRLTGFSVGSSPKKDFGGGITFLAKRTPRGEGKFTISPIPSNPGNYQIRLDNGDFQPNPTPPPTPPAGCLIGPDTPAVNITIEPDCDINIEALAWQSNDGRTHRLQVSFNSTTVGESQTMTPRSPVLYPYGSRSNPYAGHLTTGVYNVWVTGYYDADDGGALKNFSELGLSSNNYQAGAGGSGITGNGISSFEIHRVAGPDYYITEGTNRIPPLVPGVTPGPYCDLPPCPPGSANPSPPCNNPPPPCDSVSHFTENWTNNGDADAYTQYNSLWYEGSVSPSSLTTIDIATERYHSTFNGNVPSGSTIRRTSGSLGPFTSLQTPSTFFVITNAANEPGELIPGTSTITRATILADLSDFEYDFSNDPTNVGKRDSVWVLSTDSNYKPKTSVKWNAGPGTYNGSGSLTGWSNAYTLKITPKKLTYGNTNPVSTAVSKQPAGSGVPNGTGFQPQSTASQNAFVDFTTQNNQTWGLPSNNPEYDHLLNYSWEFYWQIDVEHTHTVDYDRYDQDVSKRTYEDRTGISLWVGTTYWDHDNDPDTPDVVDVPGHWEPYTYSSWSSGSVTGRNPSAPSGLSYTSPGSLRYRYEVRNVQDAEWSYYHTGLTETETRKTALTGTICNGSYVLLVQPPECRVQRRLFSSNTEKRQNPTNLDPYNPDANYEIFAPGQPTHFSRLEAINDNHFFLEPTSPQTKATLQPTLNTSSPWHPRDNAWPRGNLIGALPAVDPTHYSWMSARPWGSSTGGVSNYQESDITPLWPGEYRLNWDVGWKSRASLSGYPDTGSHYTDTYRGTNYHKWQGSEPPTQTLSCSDPADGIYVYVSAKPPVCRVRYSIFEFTDPDTRIEVGLQNNNWVNLVAVGKSNSNLTAYKAGTPGIPSPWPSSSSWPSSINTQTENLSPYGPSAYSLPQGYEAERVPGSNIPSGIPDPIFGDAAGERLATSPPTGSPLPKNLTKASYPALVSNQWLDIISDNRMAIMPAPLGEYIFSWDLRTRLGIEWWSTTNDGKLPLGPGNVTAWWAGDNNDERIQQQNSNNRLGTYQCEDIVRIARIPFIKTFIGGMSAGGRFGLGDEYDSCKNDNWVLWPEEARGAWGHSADTKDLNSAIGSSVEQALITQKGIGGIYSSSLTDQPDSHTNPTSTESKALTYANTTNGLGGGFSDPTNPANIKWRCLPNYWRIPDNANKEGGGGGSSTPIAGLTNFTSPTKPEEGAEAPNRTFGGNQFLGPGGAGISSSSDDGIELKDGHVLHIKGDLEITGDIRPANEEDLRVSIFVEGDVIISGNILNNTRPPTDKYFGFSDLGLIQIIALGDIHIQPQVTQIDATLVAYPIYSSGPVTSGGSIDLCASQTEDRVQHYLLCSTDYTVTPVINRQLRINGALVAQRVYLNRLHETLKNRDPAAPGYPHGQEPARATYDNTRASEVIVLMPEYHFVTPAASVFDDWIKRPQAVFDIPTSL